MIFLKLNKTPAYWHLLKAKITKGISVIVCCCAEHILSLTNTPIDDANTKMYLTPSKEMARRKGKVSRGHGK